MLLLVVVSCTATPEVVDACVESEPVGFLHGLWHGVISPVMLLAQIWVEDVAVYEVNNSGGWYDFGFLLGAGALASRA